ncbi:MAG: SDR family NAD(P)-dependent oxidoreductase [Myxococcota bacterium]
MSRPVCAVIGIGPKNGRSFATRFASEGYAVALLSRSTEYSSGLAAELGGKAYACDVTDPAAIESAFAEIRADLGEVAVLLYNAGSGKFGTFDDVPDDEFEKGWQINVRGLLQSVRQVVGPMRDKGEGAIVVTGATASLRGKPMTAAFAQAKAAQRSLAQSFARQLGPEGIHVALVIVDGGIGTDEDDQGDRLRPSDIADTVYHLATQPKSAWTFELDVRPMKESW